MAIRLRKHRDPRNEFPRAFYIRHRVMQTRRRNAEEGAKSRSVFFTMWMGRDPAAGARSAASGDAGYSAPGLGLPLPPPRFLTGSRAGSKSGFGFGIAAPTLVR